jgi:hypothetical protein
MAYVVLQQYNKQLEIMRKTPRLCCRSAGRSGKLAPDLAGSGGGVSGCRNDVMRSALA